jgi:hypothetical protein
VPGSRDWPGQPDAPDQPDASDTPGQLRPISPRPDSAAGPDRSDTTRPADRLAADDQQARWSRDDLRQRLERLPPGHPSSLRSDSPDIASSGERAESGPDRRPETGPDHQADAVRGAFWSELPRFSEASADHECRWPTDEAKAAVDRSRDPAGSWRGDGKQYLNPEQHRQAKDVIAVVQRREEGLTPYMGQAERENTRGGRLEGLEHRRKDDDRIKEKIAEMLKRMPDRTVEEVVRALPDIIRYTFCFKSESYTAGYWDIKGRMEERGYSMVYSKNHWRDDPQYKGINTRWVTAEGQRFEVQFHSEESFYAKQHVTHKSYERLRNPLTPDDERQELRSFQQEVCSWIDVPDDATTLPDYYWKAHS